MPADCPTIQGALNAASNGTEIIVAPGTYKENIHFSGKNVKLRSTEPDNADIVSRTVIDGDRKGTVVSFDGTETDKCILTGMTITGGLAPEGAGINGRENHASIINCRIIHNEAVSESDSTFGGGLYQCDGLVSGNLVAFNRSTNYGGGLSDCKGLIRKNVIMKNVVLFNGGGVEGAAGVVENNIITSNTASDGGGLFGITGTVRNNLVVSNQADSGGGLASCSGAVVNNTFYGNTAGYGAGLQNCTGQIMNNIIWDNWAESEPQLADCSAPTYCCIQMWTGGGTGNTAEDPQMAGPEHGQFHLQDSSPAMDAGNPAEDHNDACLPPGGRNARNDLGAYGGPYNCGWLPETSGDVLNVLLDRSDPREWRPSWYDVNSDGLIDAADLVLTILSGTLR